MTKSVGQTPSPIPSVWSRLRPLGPVAATLLALGGVALDRMGFHMAPADAGPYHRSLVNGADAVPLHIGEWTGVESEVPEGAVSLLHPNLLMARRYKNIHSGQTVSVILVQCTDARDLLGHYPPLCYPNRGWTTASTFATPRTIDDLKFTSTRYEFSSTRLDHVARILVENFMVLPDGRFCPNMDGVTEAARDPRRKFFGAAQVHVVADADLPAAQREELFEELVRAMRPLLDRIRSGIRT